MVDIERVVADIREHGYHIAKHALSEGLVNELRAEIDRLTEANYPLSLRNPFNGLKTIRFHDLLNSSAVWQTLPQHPNILPVAKEILGDDCLLNTYGTSTVGPGESEQPIHVDDGPFLGAYLDGGSAVRARPHGQKPSGGGARQSIVLAALVVLSDFTEENGATRLVPKSQHLPYPKPKEHEHWLKESVPLVAPKGSVLFWEGTVYHGGGANRSNEPRYAVLVDYCASYLRTQENFMFSVGEQRAAGFSEDLQRLIGFRVNNMGLGRVYNQVDLETRPMMAHLIVPDPEVTESTEKQTHHSPFAQRSKL